MTFLNDAGVAGRISKENVVSFEAFDSAKKYSNVVLKGKEGALLAIGVYIFFWVIDA